MRRALPGTCLAVFLSGVVSGQSIGAAPCHSLGNCGNIGRAIGLERRRLSLGVKTVPVSHNRPTMRMISSIDLWAASISVPSKMCVSKPMR